MTSTLFSILPRRLLRPLTPALFSLLAFLTLSPGLSAQVCTGDITLATQAQVDAFNCSEVTG